MPELPEVETIGQSLAPGLTGRRFAAPRVLHAKTLHAPKTKAAFAEKLAGREILGVGRRAKLLMVALGPRPHVADDKSARLVFHLKMTGRLWIREASAAPNRHVRLVFPMDDGQALFFQDVRKFGSCRLLTPKELDAWPFYASLGPEPLDMTPAMFDRALAGRTGRIKALLLNQTIIAGIGNIYADEALFAAGIKPDAKASALTAAKRKDLLFAVQDVLGKALKAGGSTIRDYRTPDGVEGGFQHHFQVYGRAGGPCPRCGATLGAKKVAGRTSTHCPDCQE